MKQARMTVSILVLAVAAAGCKKAEPPSPIVKKVEDAGSGDLSQASPKSINDWFNNTRTWQEKSRRNAQR